MAKLNRASVTYSQDRCRIVMERKVIKLPNGCWEGRTWTQKDGYCMISVDGRDIPLHKFIFEVVKHPVPIGLVLDHLCRNRRCCNPDHLEAVTQKENVHRSRRCTKEKERVNHGE